MAILRKIDCVLVRVDDLDHGIEFYQSAFGLKPLWRDDGSAGLGMPDTDAEVVLHTGDIPVDRAVNYLVDDVAEAVESASAAGCLVLVEPFDLAVGRCAVLQDPFGNAVCLLELRRPRVTASCR